MHKPDVKQNKTSWCNYFGTERQLILQNQKKQQPVKRTLQNYLSTSTKTVIKTMLQLKPLSLVLILLLGHMMTETEAKAISKRHVRRDWLIIPDTIAFNIYSLVNEVSPKVAEYLFNAVQTPIILETRNFLIRETAKLNILAEQLGEKLSGLWKELTQSAQ
ncbi:apovitellenin-1-like [Crotalus adamanteus]|uniref:Apovitellenin-1 n=1 Tax=Crotalus adamanteus TaxID=8729 RepID=A0AAW1BK38_CROAD